jgi:hypothetical protein
MSKWLPFRRKDRDQELDEEIRSHLAMALRDRIERGEETQTAELAARREFGNQTLVKETTRDMWGGDSLRSIFQTCAMPYAVCAGVPALALWPCCQWRSAQGLTPQFSV